MDPQPNKFSAQVGPACALLPTTQPQALSYSYAHVSSTLLIFRHRFTTTTVLLTVFLLLLSPLPTRDLTITSSFLSLVGVPFHCHRSECLFRSITVNHLTTTTTLLLVSLSSPSSSFPRSPSFSSPATPTTSISSIVLSSTPRDHHYSPPPRSPPRSPPRLKSPPYRRPPSLIPLPRPTISFPRLVSHPTPPSPSLSCCFFLFHVLVRLGILFLRF